MKEDHVLYEIKGSTAVITLNRPDAKNAFSPEMLDLWRDYLNRAGDDQQVHAIIVTGKGDTFCSGGDIRVMAEGKLRSWEMKRFLWERVHRVALTLESIDKPVIAAINGSAMGAGLDMALMCDMRFASEKAFFSESYILLGLVAGDGGAYFLPRLVGISKALELLLTGDHFTARDALEMGIINRITPQENLMEETLVFAEKIASKPPLAVQMMKRAVYQSQTSTLKNHLDYISSQVALLSETEDHMEAAQSFMEKRKPHFKGR